MGSFSIWHLLLLGAIVLLLFGKGRISELMGDVAQGIKSFRKGLAEEETPASPPPQASPSAPSVIPDSRVVVDGQAVDLSKNQSSSHNG